MDDQKRIRRPRAVALRACSSCSHRDRDVTPPEEELQGKEALSWRGWPPTPAVNHAFDEGVSGLQYEGLQRSVLGHKARTGSP